MESEKYLYRVTLPYLCCGLIVVDERVYEAAPIMKWAERMSLGYVRRWVHGKGGKIEVVDYGEDITV